MFAQLEAMLNIIATHFSHLFKLTLNFQTYYFDLDPGLHICTQCSKQIWLSLVRKIDQKHKRPNSSKRHYPHLTITVGEPIHRDQKTWSNLWYHRRRTYIIQQEGPDPSRVSIVRPEVRDAVLRGNFSTFDDIFEFPDPEDVEYLSTFGKPRMLIACSVKARS
jgi:hypothetical protein